VNPQILLLLLKWFEDCATEADLHGVNAIDGRFLRLTPLFRLVQEKKRKGLSHK
jgi:hypothetical protein